MSPLRLIEKFERDWQKGDEFVARGGGSVIWRIVEVDYLHVYAICLYDKDTRRFSRGHIKALEDCEMNFCPIKPLGGLKGLL